MKSLGNGTAVVWLLCAALWLSASPVRLTLEENPVIAGEEVRIGVEAEGERVKIPDLKEIGGCRVTTEGMQRLERMGSEGPSVRWIKYFSFTPQRTLQIPPITVEVDGRRYRTAPLDIRVLPRKRSGREGLAVDLNLSAAWAYVGQPVVVTVRFKERRDVPVMSVDFIPMQNSDFWIRPAGRGRTYRQGEYLIRQRRYLYFPQREGNLTVGPARVKVALSRKERDAFGFIVQRPRWVSLQSPPRFLAVQPLPPGISLVGRFRMAVKVAPTRVKAGEPVRVDVRVEGEGNIEDFSLPPLKIAGVTVYEEPPRLEQRFEHGRYRGVWQRRYVLVAERNFTVPSWEFAYFDPQKRATVQVRSRPVDVQVEPTSGERITPESAGGADAATRGYGSGSVMGVALAFLAGMGVMYLLLRRGRRRRRGGDAQGQTAARERMVQGLLPHVSRSEEAARMAEELWQGRGIDKKSYRKLLERLNKRDQRIS